MAAPRLIDRPTSAEKYRCVFRLKRRQSSKRRALLSRPCQMRSQETMTLQPLPEQPFKLLLKRVGIGKALERRLELPFL